MPNQSIFFEMEQPLWNHMLGKGNLEAFFCRNRQLAAGVVCGDFTAVDFQGVASANFQKYLGIPETYYSSQELRNVDSLTLLVSLIPGRKTGR